MPRCSNRSGRLFMCGSPRASVFHRHGQQHSRLQCAPLMPDLRLEQVTFAYPGDVRVFGPPGLTLELKAGATALVGENGAGKTTLTKLLNGLLRPTTGNIVVAGQPVAERTVAQMAALVKSMVDSDRLVLIVTHDLDFVAEACSRTVVLTRGVIRYVGPTISAFADEGMIHEAGLDLPSTTRLGLALGFQPVPVGEGAF